ncbi:MULTISPECIES: DMT family transporter [Pasteurella]|uniref:DMT family transporter n=1 Tax=Pasteurella TaxID=745 RepID=UPI00076D44AA|nr:MULTISPECIES: DMT family transporter [Pasteurella]AMM81177.1 transporter [Pasteurella multocida subsp. multocida PMTB2.1]APW57868.1 EamA family transporter [Pasteurella multocida]ATC21267.1 EamA family transporter [Pasteurella multocida]AXQ72729.1 transporter [Pasteurella multocida subsp. multocida]KWW09602.1 transporter [Pasteurella multocida]
MKQQQPLMGFLFALITAMAWGSLPIALQRVVAVMNPETIVWYRFLVAAIGLWIILGCSKKLPKISQFLPRYRLLALIGVVGLAANFVLFNTSLKYIEPSFAQIFSQLSSFTMMIFGVVFFKEKLRLNQKIGLALLVVGLILFFNDRFGLFLSVNAYSTGIFLAASAALIWSIYGIAQKLMLREFNSQQILFVIYIGCALVFTPFAEVKQVSALSGWTLFCFIYCCLNTLVGYGAYAEALNRWDISKVSVVITLMPLFTILFSYLLYLFYPQYFAEPDLNSISYIGALIVVLGAITSAIGHKFIKR